MDPKDKVAVITGGASGIGLVTARQLAARGAKVVIADINADAGPRTAQGIEADGGQARFVPTDVTKGADLQAMLDFAVGQFGRLDIAINNAGVTARGAEFLESAFDEFAMTLAVDLEGVIRGTQLEIQHLRQQGGGGVIINVASMGGLVPMPNSPVYAACKAGVIHFSRSFAYLADEGIRVNAICPTYTATALLDGATEEALAEARREAGGDFLRPEQVAEGMLELIRDDSRAGAVMRVTVNRGIDYTFEPRRPT